MDKYVIGRDGGMGQSVVVPVSDEATIAQYGRMGIPVYDTREEAEAVVAVATEKARAESAASRPDPAAGLGRSGRQDAKRFWRD